MPVIKGPAIALAQFIRNEPPFNTLPAICAWVKDLGYNGVQLPTRDSIFIDLQLAAESKTYAHEVRGTIEAAGLEITELATHTQGYLVAAHPAYEGMFPDIGPEAVHNNPVARQQWAVQQLLFAAKASEHLGLKALATFSGGLLWPTVYPWPRRPVGMVEAGFAELAKRWLPILNACEDCGVDLCFELHPGSDLHDGASYEQYLDKVNHHPRACLLYDPSHLHLQCMDYLEFIDIYHERIRAFHVKDAEFRPNGRQGSYGGYQPWAERAGRFRSLGDGQIDFRAIFKKLAAYGFASWAVMEWECPFKSALDGAREGAIFIQKQLDNLSAEQRL